MPADRIAESLAFINWTVLTSLAIGSFGAVVVTRLRTEATRGYLGFTALAAAVAGVLAAMSDGALPAGPMGLAVAPDATLEALRRVALWGFAVVAAAYGVALLRGGRAPLLAGVGAASGGTVLLTAAAAWGGSPLGALLLLVQLVALAAGLGGVWAAMILGHWYLVTPKLPEAPLVRLSRWLWLALLVQLGLFVAWTATGAGPAGTVGFGALTGPWALFVWLRLIVGLVFPIVVGWAAVQTARTRAMESATGLLYINVGTIAAGTILAAGLYYGAGVLA